MTRGQAAALVQRSKKTLERYSLPAPDTKGGGGKPDEWEYPGQIRPWLAKTFDKDKLPDRLPEPFAPGAGR